jgi:hypothetical protein
MTDPDGVSGQTTQVVKVRTRTEPQPYKGGRTLHVYPPDYFGPRQQPAFHLAFSRPTTAPASATGPSSGSAARSPAIPCSSHSGLYRPERLDYVDPMMAPFDGSMSLTLKGTPEKPITIQGRRRRRSDLRRRQQRIACSTSWPRAITFLKASTFRNTDIAIFAGQKEVTWRRRPHRQELPL